MTQSAIWKGKKGDVQVTEMATPHLQRAITKVKGELNESSVTNRSEKESILQALETEFATRSDTEQQERTA